MAATMKAFAMHGIGEVGVIEKPIPRAGPTDAIIRTTAALAMARRFGADLIVDHTREDPVEAILNATGGRGVDTAIEALGSAGTFAACVSVTRPGGTISNVGYHGDGDTVPIPRLDWGVGMSDKTIRTALCPGGSERMGRLMRLIRAKRVDPLAMTTHRFAFAEITKAFKMMQTKEDGMVKPLITFA